MNADNLYIDTSALAKLLIRKEPGADVAAEIMARFEIIHTSLLTYPETMSALTRSRRDGRLSPDELHDAVARLGTLWPRFKIIPFGERIAYEAAGYILRFPLSGADAVQIASARAIEQYPETTFATWDRRQAEAAYALGFTVEPPIN